VGTSVKPLGAGKRPESLASAPVRMLRRCCWCRRRPQLLERPQRQSRRARHEQRHRESGGRRHAAVHDRRREARARTRRAEKQTLLTPPTRLAPPPPREVAAPDRVGRGGHRVGATPRVRRHANAAAQGLATRGGDDDGAPAAGGRRQPVDGRVLDRKQGGPRRWR